MPRFHVYSGATLIGWSDLELGDPPMGVAFGRFIPSPDYRVVQSVVQAAAGGPLLEDLQLCIRDSDGAELQSSGGVHLVDLSSTVGPEGREVSILGVTHPYYETLFPEHVAAYERLFNLKS